MLKGRVGLLISDGWLLTYTTAYLSFFSSTTCSTFFTGSCSFFASSTYIKMECPYFLGKISLFVQSKSRCRSSCCGGSVACTLLSKIWCLVSRPTYCIMLLPLAQISASSNPSPAVGGTGSRTDSPPRDRSRGKVRT